MLVIVVQDHPTLSMIRYLQDTSINDVPCHSNPPFPLYLSNNSSKGISSCFEAWSNTEWTSKVNFSRGLEVERIINEMLRQLFYHRHQHKSTFPHTHW